jgi:predicted dehydrogenase
MTIGVGIIGSGFMGRTWTECVSRHVTGAQVVAVAGGTRAGALAADYGVRRMEPGELIADPAVDALVIATPPSTHRSLALAAAAAGKHLFIEKPMAQDVAECDEMVAACRAADVRLAIVSQHRFRHSPRAVKQLIESGGIGQVRMIRVMGPCAGWDVPEDTWKLDPAEQTPFADWGAHGCDILRWLAGADPVLAFGQYASYVDSPPPSQSAMAQFTFANGVLAQVWMTYEIPEPGLGSALQFLVTGSTGMVEFDAYGKVQVSDGSGWRLLTEQPPFDPMDPMSAGRLAAYAEQFQDFVDAIADHREPAVSGASARVTIEMLDAVARSAATGDAVRMSLRG